VRLALIGDIHLYSLQVRPRQLLGKRLLGHTNLWLNRRHRFNHRMLGKVMEKVEQIAPDLALFSGDVTTTSLENEFHDINQYLKPLSEKLPLLVVPGNHDRYTFRSSRKKRMETIMNGMMPSQFPHMRQLTDRWHLMGLDSAIPQLFLSRGALGKGQLHAIDAQLQRFTENDGLIVLCHYPVALPAGLPRSWTHDLAEGQQLRKLLEQCPAKVVFMHGHVHKPWYARPNNHDRLPFVCLNAGSPCLTSDEFPLGQGFWQIELPDDPNEPLGLIHHVLEPQRDLAADPDRDAEHLDPRWVGHQVV
jgi:3',5'-cyclic AMP phosphodiesterase CpdA